MNNTTLIIDYGTDVSCVNLRDATFISKFWIWVCVRACAGGWNLFFLKRWLRLNLKSFFNFFEWSDFSEERRSWKISSVIFLNWARESFKGKKLKYTSHTLSVAETTTNKKNHSNKKVINFPTFEFLLLLFLYKGKRLFYFYILFRFRGRFIYRWLPPVPNLSFSWHRISITDYKQFIYFFRKSGFRLERQTLFKIIDRTEKIKSNYQRNEYSRWHLLHPANKNIKRVDRRIIFTLLTWLGKRNAASQVGKIIFRPQNNHSGHNIYWF